VILLIKADIGMISSRCQLQNFQSSACLRFSYLPVKLVLFAHVLLILIFVLLITDGLSGLDESTAFESR